MLINGRDFIGYFEAKADSPAAVQQAGGTRSELFLYFAPGSGPAGSLHIHDNLTSSILGALCWCPRGHRAATPSNMIPMHLVTDLFLGNEYMHL